MESSFKGRIFQGVFSIVVLFFVEGLNPTLAQGATVPTITLPTKTITVYNPDIGFQNMMMSSFKVIDEPSFKRIGIVIGDTLLFKAVLTPDVPLTYEKYSWSGAQGGTGQMISVNFTHIGPNAESVTVGGKTKTAIAKAIVLESIGENAWCILNPISCLTVSAAAEEARIWASDNQVSLGNGLRNGRADASRHTYWNALMAVDGLTSGVLLEASTAHETSNLNAGAQHNEIVMDLENNLNGAVIGVSLGMGAARTAVDTAVRAALASGTLTILDDLGNASEVGLLQPSNR